MVAKYYWRDGGKEVNLMVGKIPVEVKAGRKVYDWDLKNLKYFMRRFNVSEGVLIYHGNEFEEADGIKIVPLFDFCYTTQRFFRQ